MANAAQFLVAKHVFDFVAAHPGKKQEDVVAALEATVTELKRSPATARTMLYALKRAGAIVRLKEKGQRAGTFEVAPNLKGIELSSSDFLKYVTRAPIKVATEAMEPVKQEVEAIAVAAEAAPEYDVTKFSPPKGEGDLRRGPKGHFLPRFVRA